MKNTLWADLLGAKVVRERKGWFWKHLVWGIIFKPPFACVFWYRVNRWMYLKKFPHLVVLSLSVWRFYTFANDISYQADIGEGFMVAHTHGIVVGGRARIGKRCLLRHNVTVGAASNDTRGIEPTLGDDVEVGAHTMVIGGITIGDRTQIGAMSLITKDVDAGMVIYGIPPNQAIRHRIDIKKPL